MTSTSPTGMTPTNTSSFLWNDTVTKMDLSSDDSTSSTITWQKDVSAKAGAFFKGTLTPEVAKKEFRLKITSPHLLKIEKVPYSKEEWNILKQVVLLTEKVRKLSNQSEVYRVAHRDAENDYNAICASHTSQMLRLLNATQEGAGGGTTLKSTSASDAPSQNEIIAAKAKVALAKNTWLAAQTSTFIANREKEIFESSIGMFAFCAYSSHLTASDIAILSPHEVQFLWSTRGEAPALSPTEIALLEMRIKHTSVETKKA